MFKRLGLVVVLLLAAVVAPLSALGSDKRPEGGSPPLAAPAAPAAPAGIIVSSAPLTVDQAVYDDTADGRTGRFLVLLRSQADVKAAAAAGLAGRQPSGRDSAAWADQGQAVFDAVRSVAAATQPAVTAQLDALGATYKPYYAANLLSVEGSRAAVDALAARADVLAIESNREFRVPLEDLEAAENGRAPDTVEWNVTKIHAPDLWALGFTGQNIVVANADVGVQWDHPALKPHYRGWGPGGANHNYNWWDGVRTPIVGGSPCGYASPVPCPDGSHGTHTTGTAVGDDYAGNQIGVAPGAKWIACRNMDQNVGRPNTYIECLQFFLAPTDLNGQNPQPGLRADVVGNSYGCPLGVPPGGEDCAANSLTAVVQTLRAAGIFMSVSAGNDGSSCSSVNAPPGTEASVITVGATASNDVITYYSSRGPVTIDGSNRLKPNVVAPGSSVTSSVPTNGYGVMSGTSMAAPAVAGAVAVLWSAVPALRGNVDLTQQIFQDSATHLTTSENCGGVPGSQIPNNTYGYGLINVQAAYNMVVGVATTPATAGQLSTAGSAIPFTLHVTNTGYLADTFTFSRAGGAWTWDLPANLTLAAGAGQDLIVTVHVPDNVPVGASDTAAVTAISMNDAAKTATSTLTAIACYRTFFPYVEK